MTYRGAERGQLRILGVRRIRHKQLVEEGATQTEFGKSVSWGAFDLGNWIG